MNCEKIQEILRVFRIEHKDQPRAVNVNCPFCLGQTRHLPDNKFRCGIFPESLRFHCWRCKRVGSFFQVLSAAAGIDRKEYQELMGGSVEKTEDESVPNAVRRKLKGKKAETKSEPPKLPESVPVNEPNVRLHPELMTFLAKRQISVDTCEDYETRYTGAVGRYAERLILPNYGEDGRLEVWQGRDVSGRAKAKYLTEGSCGRSLYWSSHLIENQPVYLVEGAFDCWRMVHNAVASYTKDLTREQRALLARDLDRLPLIIAWDYDAYDKARAVARELAPVLKTGVVRLPDGEDPDSLGGRNVRKLKVEWM